MAFNAVTYLITAAGNVSASYDSVCDLFDELAQFTTRLSVHTRQDISPELRGIVVEILCSLIRLCGYAGRLIKHGRVGEYFKKLYLGKDNEVAKELATLRRLTDAEAKMTGALTFSATTRTAKKVDGAVLVLSSVDVGVREANLGINELRDQVSSLVVKMNEMRTEDRNEVEQKRLEKIRLVLSPSVTPEEIYRAISGKRVPGTGDWVHGERLFRSWLDREKPILWISGGPGAGKSYLSSNIIQLLTQLHPPKIQASSQISIAYYFCKDHDPNLRSFNNALRTLAYQICQNDNVYAKYVASVCSFPEDIRTTESLWQKLFIDFYGKEDTQSTVYILIDGVDEAFEQERAKFLELLKSVQNEGNRESVGGKSRIQILMVGRPELNYDIENVLAENLPTISVNATKNSADIHQYVTTRVPKERNLRRISNALREEIIVELTKGADGMFLWVDLMLKEVSSKHKEIQMRQALHEAPRGLFDTIQHTLERIRQEVSSEDAQDLMTLLAWVTCAKRPFKLGELEDIVKFTSRDGEGVIYLEGELRKRYASFFNVIREDGLTTEDLQLEHLIVIPEDENADDVTGGETAIKTVKNDTGTFDDFGEDMEVDSDPQTTEVTLSHASFGDFFREHRSDGNANVDYKVWSLEITKHLLKILCEEAVWDKWKSDNLPAYAAAYWQDHLRDVDFESTPKNGRIEIAKRLVSMFRDDKVIERWLDPGISCEKPAWYRSNEDMRLFRQAWIHTDENCDTVRRWLTSSSSELSEQDRLWSDSLLQNTEAHLLDQVVAASARYLLKRDDCFAEPHFMTLKAYRDKISARENHGVAPKATEYASSRIASIPPETILEYVRHLEFKEDFMWNIRVARVLREAGHYETAKTFYQNAIHATEIEKRSHPPWQSCVGLGTLYERVGNHTEAIKYFEQAKTLFENHPDSKPKNEEDYALRMLVSLYDTVGDIDSALALSRQILKRDPLNYWAATRFVGLLLDHEKYSDAMKVFREAEEEVLEDKGHSRLTDWCILVTRRLRDDWNFREILFTACRATGDIEFGKAVYLAAIGSVKKSDSDTLLLLQAEYGALLLYDFKKSKKAAHIFETIMEETKGGQSNTVRSYVRHMVCNILCNIYTSKALVAGKGTADAARNIEKLSKLWTPQEKSASANESNDALQDMVDGDGILAAVNTTLSLAYLYQAFDEPEKARLLLKLHVKLGLEILTDDDLDNDWHGWWRLAYALSRAGDTAGALTAWSMSSPRWVVETTPAATSSDASNPAGDAATLSAPAQAKADGNFYSCDGCAKEGEWGVEQMYCCIVCIDICFEENCYKRLMDDKLQINVCSRDHEFIYVPKSEPVRKGFVPVAGKMVPEAEWMAEIRKQWEL